MYRMLRMPETSLPPSGLETQLRGGNVGRILYTEVHRPGLAGEKNPNAVIRHPLGVRKASRRTMGGVADRDAE